MEFATFAQDQGDKETVLRAAKRRHPTMTAQNNYGKQAKEEGETNESVEGGGKGDS